MITEKLNLALKQHLDTLKESVDQKLSTVSERTHARTMTSLIDSRSPRLGDERGLSFVAAVRVAVRVAVSRVHAHGRARMVQFEQQSKQRVREVSGERERT